MHKKQVDSIEVELDEIGLSVLGWEVSKFEARLVTDIYDSFAEHRVATSKELRFHPDDWQVRHTRDSEYLPHIIWQIRSRRLGALSPYSWASTTYESKELRRPVLASETSAEWWESYPHDPNDLYVWVGAYDWTECLAGAAPSGEWQPCKHEFIDQRTLRGVGSQVTEIGAQADDNLLVVTLRMIHPLGSIEDLLASGYDRNRWAVRPSKRFYEEDEFEVPGPRVIFQLFDKSGFLLDNVDHRSIGVVKIGIGLARPTRPPTSVTVSKFYLDELAGEVSRVVIRLQDPP